MPNNAIKPNEELSSSLHVPAQVSLRPLVATLVMAKKAQEYFNQLRQLHFRVERNNLDAHLTLFHALPDEPWIIEEIKDVIKGQNQFEVTVNTVVSLSDGKAFKILSSELPAMHQKFRNRWSSY